MDQTKMSNESIKKASLSSSSSPTPSTSSSSAAADSYIGSFISLTSKYEIRYEGVLYFLNPQDSTLGLKNVKLYGTEGRRKDGLQIPPNDKVHEYILFRGSDIKDLQVKSSPPSQTEESIHSDPAIIQSHYGAGPSSSSRSLSVGRSSRSSDQEPPAFATGPYPGALPTPYSRNHAGPFAFETSQNAQMSGMPRHWQGNDGASSSSPYAPQYPNSSVSAAASPAEHNHLQSPAMQIPMIAGLSNVLNVTAESLAVQDNLQAPAGLSNSFNVTAPVQSHVTSSLLHSNTRLTFDPYFNSPANLPSTSFVMASLSSHPAVPTANSISMPSLPSSSQNSSIVDSQIANKGFNPGSVLPIQHWPHALSLAANSTSGPLLSQPPILLTPGQLSQSRTSALTSTMKPFNGQNELGPMSPVSSFTTPAIQAPLLPVPASAKPSQHSSQFTEEFDFEAMNEKFKKDEVWGYLGKSKQKEFEGIENDIAGQSLGNEEVHGAASNVYFKPAYNKDEFFDTISCHSVARGTRNGQHQFSERLRLDTETFGNFPQINHPVYGSHGFGRGENRGPYGWGRGYEYKNYGGRGRGGGYMRM